MTHDTSPNAAPNLQRICQQLKGLQSQLNAQWGITSLAVFGSVARGEATPTSDIDILFDYDRPLGLEIVTLGDFLEEQLGYRVDLLSRKAVRDKVWPFIAGEICDV